MHIKNKQIIQIISYLAGPVQICFLRPCFEVNIVSDIIPSTIQWLSFYIANIGNLTCILLNITSRLNHNAVILLL